MAKYIKGSSMQMTDLEIEIAKFKNENYRDYVEAKKRPKHHLLRKSVASGLRVKRKIERDKKIKLDWF